MKLVEEVDEVAEI